MIDDSFWFPQERVHRKRRRPCRRCQRRIQPRFSGDARHHENHRAGIARRQHLGSADGAAWEPKSIAAFPQKFYCGESPLLLDLTAHPDVKFVRAHWEVARWGRGTETPMFEFGVTLKEVPPRFCKRRAEAKALA